MALSLNQRTPFAGLPADGDVWAETFPAVSPANYNVAVPLSYWTDQPSLPPPGTTTRTAQLREFRRLYEGDLSVIMGDRYPVRVNYFRRLADNMADFMLAYPPVAGGSDDLQQLLDDAVDVLADAVVDLVRFGTCLLRVYRDSDGPHLEAPSPEGWFPAADGTAALLTYGADGLYRALLCDGGSERQVVYESYSDPESAEPDGLNPVSPLTPVSTTEVDPSFALDGPTLWPVTLGGRSGPWGTSLYGDLYPLVTELCRRMSKTGHILNRHADPMLAFTEDPNARPYSDSAEDRTVTVAAQRVFLDETRQQPVIIMPPDFQKAEYVVWDAQMLASNSHMASLKEELFMATRVAPILFGTQIPASVGTSSLRKVFAPTYTFLRRVRIKLQATLERALSVVLSEDVALDWPDTMDQLDRQIIENIGVPGQTAATAREAVEDTPVTTTQSPGGGRS